ncbi:beta-lactamase/transpeptidase-like protein [Lentithecium fluviatile CBS 122367]|uniref:Beta-lactamase/transpeptidase-like protein n=1 Tax=Lentithecium fluviatile CBS 122367 TaxID=1168545 RepID=A0A6G1J7E1_9PLEO|nr:beta-lactamase/transpeptidase-like protein [Lentithecium fluviatile CBS 122367]
MPELTLTEELDSILEKYTSNIPNRLHGAAFSAVNTKGSEILYSQALGLRTLPNQDASPLQLDSTMWIGSITKLQTCMACMTGLERGLFTLDTNVREIVPELKSIDLLAGFEDGDFPRKPITKPCTSPITLRQLLTHTSGMIYDYGHDGLKEWSAYHGIKDNTFSGTLKGYTKPLIYEPGQGWAYSPGMDWAGRLLEVTSGLSLEEFLKQTIWDKLGMKSTTFRPDLRPDIQARRMAMASRNRQTMEITQGVVPQEAQGSFAPDCCGGVGLYSTIEDCTRVLQALGSKNPMLMTAESYELLTTPQLPSNEHFLKVIRGVGQGHLGQTWDTGAEGTFGFGSSIIQQDFVGRRVAGSCNWSGMPGTHCWLDKKTGIGGMLTTQILPPGDPMVTQLLLELEKCLYRHIRG